MVWTKYKYICNNKEIDYVCYEANHNKDFSVVKTFTIVPQKCGIVDFNGV
jgi:hypothetical protein